MEETLCAVYTIKFSLYDVFDIIHYHKGDIRQNSVRKIVPLCTERNGRRKLFFPLGIKEKVA